MYVPLGMLALTIGLTVIAAISVFRVEHLIASDVWLFVGGERWQTALTALRGDELRDPDRMWACYQCAGGGKLPFLFFGIRSHRLLAWSRHAASRPWRSAALKACRWAWRYFYFAPAMSTLVMVLSFVPSRMSSVGRYDLLVIATSTAIGLVAIAAEGTLAAIMLDSWAVKYHRFAPDGPRKNRVKELAVVLGCLAFALYAASSLVALVAMRFHGYTSFPHTDAVLTRLRAVVQIAIPGILSNAWGDVANLAGLLASSLIGFLYLSYLVILMMIGGPMLWNPPLSAEDKSV